MNRSWWRGRFLAEMTTNEATTKGVTTKGKGIAKDKGRRRSPSGMTTRKATTK
jgi:hypothetical protein